MAVFFLLQFGTGGEGGFFRRFLIFVISIVCFSVVEEAGAPSSFLSLSHLERGIETFLRGGDERTYPLQPCRYVVLKALREDVDPLGDPRAARGTRRERTDETHAGMS